MSASGQLVYFSSLHPADFTGTYAHLLHTLQISAFKTISNYADESTNSLKVLLGKASPSITRGEWLRVENYQPVETSQYLRRGRVLGFSTYSSPIIAEINSAVRALPESVVDRWIVDAAMVQLGAHELFEASDSVKHFGHAEISISFGGSGSPLDWLVCRQMVLELPVVKAFAKRLEPILGEVKTCVYWDG